MHGKLLKTMVDRRPVKSICRPEEHKGSPLELDERVPPPLTIPSRTGNHKMQGNTQIGSENKTEILPKDCYRSKHTEHLAAQRLDQMQEDVCITPHLHRGQHPPSHHPRTEVPNPMQQSVS